MAGHTTVGPHLPHWGGGRGGGHDASGRRVGGGGGELGLSHGARYPGCSGKTRPAKRGWIEGEKLGGWGQRSEVMPQVPRERLSASW